MRRAEGALVVEGAELLSAAVAAGAPVESVYVAPGGRDGAAEQRAVEQAYGAGARVFDLAPGVIERVADTVTPQPVLAVVGYAPATADDLGRLGPASMVMVWADVRDPGNAGTMIRTADAAGWDAVVCCEGTVDPTNPKTVRASSGSLFHLPVVSGGEPREVVGRLEAEGFVTIGAVVRDGVDYATVDWSRRIALIFGNEAAGLDPALAGRLDERVSIPMAGRAESLNVGSAAAVLCFEAQRQRRTGAGSVDAPSTMLSMSDPRSAEGSR